MFIQVHKPNELVESMCIKQGSICSLEKSFGIQIRMSPISCLEKLSNVGCNISTMGNIVNRKFLEGQHPTQISCLGCKFPCTIMGSEWCPLTHGVVSLCFASKKQHMQALPYYVQHRQCNERNIMGWDEIVGKSSSSSGSAKCLMANEIIHIHTKSAEIGKCKQREYIFYLSHIERRKKKGGINTVVRTSTEYTGVHSVDASMLC